METRGEETLAAAFLAAASRNPSIVALLDRLEAMAIPSACLAGGCLFQTAWNLAHGFEPANAIADYDVFYFDPDVSADAEEAVAGRLRTMTADLDLHVDVRNQARVHLWYEREYGTRSPRFRSAEEGIDHFLATCCALGLKREGSRLVAYAPFGYHDLFSLIVRPNPRRVALNGAALRCAYDRKVRRWCDAWPRLRVVPWPD